MKVPHPIAGQDIRSILERSYGIHAAEIRFIPVGDSSYGYKIIGTDDQAYFLKMLDKSNQAAAVERAGYYLPLLDELHRHRLFPHANYPIVTKEHAYAADNAEVLCILFPWLEGPTMADDHPFTEAVIREIAVYAARLHKQTPAIVKYVRLPVERFTPAPGQELAGCLEQLPGMQSGTDRYKRALASLLLPKERVIRALANDIMKLRDQLLSTHFDQVVCHGDIWGGNLIRTPEGLCLIDWEAAVLAPRERELAGFITQHFEAFVDAYAEELGMPVIPDVKLLRYYAFQRQLNNLANWTVNILVRNKEEAQQENDLEMIEFHCLDRWEELESVLNILEGRL